MKKINASINMEQKLKDLLVKDLCARLPYGVKCNINFNQKDSTLTTELLQGVMTDSISLKPYLRPMSSMTEEERKEYELLANHCIVTSIGFAHLEAQMLINWLNAHHFDYRGLIPMGLALEAPAEMYK
jgi:hypothetical protein